MDRERFKRLEAIFDQSVKLEGEARREFLDRACAGDAALREQVEKLLAQDEKAITGPGGNPVDQVPALVADAVADGSTPAATIDGVLSFPGPSRRIDGYRILKKLGEGGMGTVYLAEQITPRRRVALKMIRPDLLTPSLYKRFQLEIDLLGRLQHPGIAQIYEAGKIDTEKGGLPYFAMEYIQGMELRAFVQKHALGVREKLELAARICDAAHHAHLNGIIHRDLKPDNVLVTEAPATTAAGEAHEFARLGQPKVLDFGVARATDLDIQVTTLQTDVGKLVGTITYMSPEQVAGDSRLIDMRSDIYALGSIAYELLAGRPPFDLRNKPIPEAARIIGEDEPTRIGSARSEFRGEIDTIITKALEKDRDRRYGSAADLAADIRRYLAHEPITAHPPSAFYELRKFARRHKGLVAGLVLAFLILVIGIASSLTFALRATHNETVANRTAYRLKIATAQALGDADPLQALEHLESVLPEDRGWEWRHHYARFVSHLAEFSGDAYHPSSSTIARLPDGRLVAALNREGGIEVTDVATGAIHTVIGGPRELMINALSADASLLSAWCPSEHKLMLFDVEQKACLHEFPFQGDTPFSCLSPDNTLWAIQPHPSGELVVMDISTGRRTLEIELEYNYPYMAFDPGGESIAFYDNKTLHVYSTTGRQIASKKLEAGARSMAFSPDGKLLAIGHSLMMISIFDVSTLEVQKVFYCPGETNEYCHAVAFSSDSVYLASAWKDDTLRIWNVDEGRIVRGLPAPSLNRTESLAFSRDGSMLVAGHSAEVHLWKWMEDSRRVYKGHPTYVYSATFSPDGTIVASYGYYGEVHLWDVMTGEFLACFPDGAMRHGAGFSADGTRLVFRSQDPQHQLGPSGLTVRDMGTGLLLTSPRQPEDRALFDVLQGDDDFLRIAPRAKHINRAGETKASSADGAFIADVQNKKEIHLLDPATRKTIKPIGRHDANLYSVTFSPNASMVASGDSDGVVKVWDVESGAERAVLEGHHGIVYSVVFSPDGSLIASGGSDGIIVLWDADTFERLTVLREHNSYVHSVCFSPDGTMLASASGDGTVRIWDSLLPSERWDRIQRDRTLQWEAGPMVDRLLDELDDPMDVADRLRADDELNDDLRRAALRVLLKRSPR